jgi:hypothetical protein
MFVFGTVFVSVQVTVAVITSDFKGGSEKVGGVVSAFTNNGPTLAKAPIRSVMALAGGGGGVSTSFTGQASSFAEALISHRPFDYLGP